jgi:hypothetical protein
MKSSIRLEQYALRLTFIANYEIRRSKLKKADPVAPRLESACGMINQSCLKRNPYVAAMCFEI